MTPGGLRVQAPLRVENVRYRSAGSRQKHPVRCLTCRLSPSQAILALRSTAGSSDLVVHRPRLQHVPLEDSGLSSATFTNSDKTPEVEFLQDVHVDEFAFGNFLAENGRLSVKVLPCLVRTVLKPERHHGVVWNGFTFHELVQQIQRSF